MTTSSQHDAAILFVSARRGSSTFPLCLELKNRNTAADPTRPLYHILRRHRSGFPEDVLPLSPSELGCPEDVLPLAVFDPEKEFSQSTADGRNRWAQFLSAPWRTVYFAHSPPDNLSTAVRIPMNRDITAPFHIPPGKVLAKSFFDPQFVGATMTAVASQTPQLTLALEHTW